MCPVPFLTAILRHRHSLLAPLPQMPSPSRPPASLLARESHSLAYKTSSPKEYFSEMRTVVPPTGSMDLSLRNIAIDVT